LDFILHEKSIDVLINNAGFFLPGEIQNEEEGVLEAQNPGKPAPAPIT
jgi:short-subunit dehydrogenase